MTPKEYWAECIACGADEIGLRLTAEQIDALADSVNGGHENYSIAFGYDVADRNYTGSLQRKIEEAKAEARRERAKVHCRECNGHGRIELQGPYHSSNSECFKCHGAGRHDP